MIKYDKLFEKLKREKRKQAEIIEILSAGTLNKLRNNKTVQTDVLDKICKRYNCKLSDIAEYIPDEQSQEDGNAARLPGIVREENKT